MEASEAARLVDALEEAGVAVWLDGGWGVDALLEEQTREHDDLDLIVALDDVRALVQTLRDAGYEQVAGRPPMSFVLVDASGRQIDVHPVSFDDERGGGVYVMDDGRRPAIWGSHADDERERALALQAECAYQRLVTDWQRTRPGAVR